MANQLKKLSTHIAIGLLALCTMKAIAADSATTTTQQGLAAATSTNNQSTTSNQNAANPAENSTANNGSEPANAMPTTTSDPFAQWNRSAYQVNDLVDRVALKPVAQAYTYMFPQQVRTGVSNFYNNLDEVPTVANDLLQFSFLQALNDSWRLFINTTIGIGGIFDVASQAGLPAHYSDFGLTLAKWGYVNSPYFEVPLLGPGTLRDQIAFPINYYGLMVYPRINPYSTRAILVSGAVINLRANLLTYNNLMQQISIDPYVLRRDAYMQHRAYLVQQALAEKPFYIPNGEPSWKTSNNNVNSSN